METQKPLWVACRGPAGSRPESREWVFVQVGFGVVCCPLYNNSPVNTNLGCAMHIAGAHTAMKQSTENLPVHFILCSHVDLTHIGALATGVAVAGGATAAGAHA